MILLVYGSRNFSDKNLIRDVMEPLIPYIEFVVNGGAPGADTLGKEVAEEFGLEVVTEEADWDKYGKAAGPIRNSEMIRKYKPDYAIGFIMGDRIGRGSQDMSHKLDTNGIYRDVFVSKEKNG